MAAEPRERMIGAPGAPAGAIFEEVAMKTEPRVASPKSWSKKDPAAQPIVIKVLQEERGWFVESAVRIGPFFAKKTATDIAADWVAALRASGDSAGVVIEERKDFHAS
jgi:hypothetical protein